MILATQLYAFCTNASFRVTICAVALCVGVVACDVRSDIACVFACCACLGLRGRNVWCVPALRVPLVHSLINHFRQKSGRAA